MSVTTVEIAHNRHVCDSIQNGRKLPINLLQILRYLLTLQPHTEGSVHLCCP